jgi:hypothetical protein
MKYKNDNLNFVTDRMLMPSFTKKISESVQYLTDVVVCTYDKLLGQYENTFYGIFAAIDLELILSWFIVNVFYNFFLK